LDLCLKPYPIMAMSQDTGLVEFVEGSIPISQILANHNNSILSFFKSVAPLQGAKYDVDPNIMQTYIRSCAGYCVITYLIGVGDRHLYVTQCCQTIFILCLLLLLGSGILMAAYHLYSPNIFYLFTGIIS